MDKVLNIGKHLSEAALRHPDNIGLIQGGESWTWEDLNSRADAFAQGLTDLGVRRGDVVFVMTPNNVTSYECIYSMAKLGVVQAPLNFRATAEEVTEFAEVCQPSVFVVHQDSMSCAEAALRIIPNLRVIVIGTLPEEKRRVGWQTYEEIVSANRGAVVQAVFVKHSDVFRIGFSSGSTGKPKAIVNTYGQMIYTVLNRLADVMVGVTVNDALLAIGPLSHGTRTAIMTNTARAAKTVMLSTPQFREEECWDLIERHKITSLFLVPTMLMRLIRHPTFAGRDTSQLRHVVYAGAPISRADQKLAIRSLGHALVQYYGSGESLGHGTVLGPDLHTLDDDDPDIPVGTIGVARTGTDIEIMSADMEPLPVGETGMLCIRRGPGVFGGYYQAEDADAEVFRGDWLLTGDLARRDGRGFYYVVGRTKDIYKSGGMQVFPNETEAYLIEHPAVAEAYVVPFPDSEWGEIGVAVVTLNEGQNTTEESLIAHLRSRIAAYKLPKRIYIWDEIERASNGKVLKPAVKQEIYARGLAAEGKDIR